MVVVAALVVSGCGGDSVNLPDKPQIQPDKVQLNFGADFGNAVYVDTTVFDTVNLQNKGKGDLVISKVELSGADAANFAITGDPTCPSTDPTCTTAAHASATVLSTKSAFVQVAFAPTKPGKSLATLTITSNAENTPSLAIAIGNPADTSLQPTAVWKYKSLGTVTDNPKTGTPKPLANIKVSCQAPAGKTCTGDVDCAADGKVCFPTTGGRCVDKQWKSWSFTTTADGTYSMDHSWDCGEILAEDGAAPATYASAAGLFTGDGNKPTNFKLDPIYNIHGKVVDEGGVGLGSMKVTCITPLSQPLSWSGWDVTTAADGTFSKTHVWGCKEIDASDPANVYGSGSAPFNPDIDLSITLKLR
jgi:hypothetical protein